MQDEMDETENMLEDVQEYKQNVAPGIFLSIILTFVTFSLTFFDYLPWKIVGVEGLDHVTLKDRCIFTLQLSFIDILPLLFSIFAVFNQRRQTYAINPMDPRGDEYVERSKGILENTLEQFVIKLILSFILCTVLRSYELLLLPVFTLLFVIGRFTFAFGYPNHRSFGMTMNFTSVILVTIIIFDRLLIKGVILQYIYWK